MKQLFGIAFLTVSLAHPTSSPVMAADQVEPVSEAWRVGTMGQQRMLSQRLVKSVCMSGLAQTEAAQDYAKQFEAVLASYTAGLAVLRDGDQNKGRKRETNPRLLESIASVSKEWSLLSAIATEVSEGSQTSPQEMLDLDAQSLIVLSTADTAAQQFSKQYGSSTLQARMSETINLAGRQRMLTQKMSKELCLAAKGQQKAINLHRFGASVSLFDTTLRALLEGDFERRLPRAPTKEIEEHLRALTETWQSNQRLAADIVARGEVTQFQLMQFTTRADALLTKSHEVVQLYQAL